VEAAEATISIARDLQNYSKPIQFVLMGSVGNSLDAQSAPDNVTITGYVEDDFEAHFDASDIALNPMLSGGGTNIKLFDYFARSLPVVSTPFGVRGIDVEGDVHLVISELNGIVEHILQLASDRQERYQFGVGSRKLTRERYTWEVSSKRVRDGFIELNHT
jgi:glycosyltransferase involved in cell wall biosynthesis